MNSATPQTAFNATRFPVYDRNGQPFNQGDRVQFRIPTYYVNTTSGTGTIDRIDQYGGVYLVCDQPLPVIRDRNGSYSETRREQYVAGVLTFDHAQRRFIATGKLGDPYEHGTTVTFIERI